MEKVEIEVNDLQFTELVSYPPDDERPVSTIKGVFPMHRLQTREVRGEGPNDIGFAREWFLDGELVRRDALVMILNGLEAGSQQGKVAT